MIDNEISIDLLIIIVTYNSENYIRQCLAPFNNKPQNWEVMIIDNNSNDNTIDIIKNEYNYVNLIKNNSNLGFGAANNIGLKYALYNNIKHILLLNADAYISIKDVSKLIELQKNNPEYYILSPIHYDSTIEHLDNGFLNYIKSSNEFIEASIIGKYTKDIYQINFVNAAIWLMNLQCLKDIGGFNPTFYHYEEDANYLDRILYHKKLCGITPFAKAVHDRAHRPDNPLFDEKYKRKYRIIVKNLSNPNLYFYKILRKFLFANIFKFYKKKNAYILIKLLKNIKIIYNNLIISKKLGPSFLNTKDNN